MTEPTNRRPEDFRIPGARTRRLLARLGPVGGGLVVSSTTASAHEFGHGSVGDGGAAAAFTIVLGLPILAGLAGGYAVVRYRSRRECTSQKSLRVRRESNATDPGSSVAVGLLLVGLGAVSILSVVTGHRWPSVAGGVVGAAFALWVTGGGLGVGCGNHAELALGVVSAHRLLEGVVLGTLYSVGAAVGLLGAVVLAGHTVLETAAVGGLYATARRRIRAVVAVVLVQASYVVGGVAGLGLGGVVPVSIRALALAGVGGALLVVGVRVTLLDGPFASYAERLRRRGRWLRAYLP